ncbi:hypothetical protein OIE69_43495 (plasmid) [Actinacidiphila glaucinigra]|uniref:hypothetical protein n=1 Tax=Actinacidiphila glaucinigra TaxID=235986 RepID=UPI002DD9E07D|nr:hypothetical protein [Actinacidiphila glaucinigra]WSD65774.1 hypothetical protein OIE69_43495 [Actinacidiphila glaucinigra]
MLSPPPIEAPFTAPSQATHDNLAAELASLQVPHTTSADSAGHYVEVPLLNDFILQLHNPLGSSYGYDWAVLNEGTQVATGTWHLSPQPTAERLQALLDAVGTNSGADTD